jgi:hypothetical protein
MKIGERQETDCGLHRDGRERIRSRRSCFKYIPMRFRKYRMTQVRLQGITDPQASAIHLPHASSTLSDALPRPVIFVHAQRFVPLSTPIQAIPPNTGPVIYFPNLASPVPDHSAYASLCSLSVDNIDAVEDFPVRGSFVAPPISFLPSIRSIRPIREDALPGGRIAPDAPLDRTAEEWRRIREVHDTDDRVDSAWNLSLSI